MKAVTKSDVWLRGIAIAALTLAVSGSIAYAADDAAPPAPEGTNVGPVKVVQPAQINLAPELAEIVRLAQSGADDSVVLAYIQKSVPTNRISSDEIVYLQDLGISQPVLKALIEHSPTGKAEGSEPIEPGVEASTTNPPAAEVAQPPPVTTTNVAPLTPPQTVNTFYDSLTPYGTWVDVAPYGWCWQPTVVVVSPGWQPYCDNGYWLWSDCGWYWHSYYTWGWAPFHYGRWFHHPARGWIWWPDHVWGPSWVCWRSSPTYWGWAPLPPGAHFSAGLGWTFNGAAVSVGFGFGLAASHFAFVAPAHFTDHHVATHRIAAREANAVFSKTTVINNYVVGSNNRIINQGVDRARVEAATHTPIREVAVRELPHEANRVTRPDRVTKVGNSEVVFRPGPQIAVPRPASPPVMRATTRPGSTMGRLPLGRTIAPPAGVPPAPSAPPNPRPAPPARPTPPQKPPPQAQVAPRPASEPEATTPPVVGHPETTVAPRTTVVTPPHRAPIMVPFRAPSDPRVGSWLQRPVRPVPPPPPTSAHPRGPSPSRPTQGH
jgi:hypothetical protein